MGRAASCCYLGIMDNAEDFAEYSGQTFSVNATAPRDATSERGLRPASCCYQG